MFLETNCGRPLGMTSGEISIYQISTSSHIPSLPPSEGRLHGESRWCADTKFIDTQFIQVGKEYCLCCIGDITSPCLTPLSLPRTNKKLRAVSFPSYSDMFV